MLIPSPQAFFTEFANQQNMLTFKIYEFLFMVDAAITTIGVFCKMGPGTQMLNGISPLRYLKITVTTLIPILFEIVA